MNSLKIMFLFWPALAFASSPYSRLDNDSEPKISRSDQVANPETTTPNGCKCNSVCSATASDGFKNDWCKVDEQCGEYSYAYGYWDYCLYKDSGRPDFAKKSWKDKHDWIWNKITEDPSLGDYYPMSTFTQSPMEPFENQWDYMPVGRVKSIHGNGVVCPFEIKISSDSKYTGLFKADSTNSGFIRLGSATDFTKGLGMCPGAGVKMMRTGTTSANFVAINQLDPLENSFNFFAVDLSTHIPDNVKGLGGKAFQKKACTTGHCIGKVGVSNFCTHDQDGNEYSEPIFPFKLTLQVADLHFMEEQPSSQEEFLAQFEVLPTGTKLYTLKAFNGPDDSEGFSLGDIVTSEKCVSSKYGDTQMMFRHQWIEEDAELKPEWKNGYFADCHCNH